MWYICFVFLQITNQIPTDIQEEYLANEYHDGIYNELQNVMETKDSFNSSYIFETFENHSKKSRKKRQAQCSLRRCSKVRIFET